MDMITDVVHVSLKGQEYRLWESSSYSTLSAVAEWTDQFPWFPTIQDIRARIFLVTDDKEWMRTYFDGSFFPSSGAKLENLESAWEEWQNSGKDKYKAKLQSYLEDEKETTMWGIQGRVRCMTGFHWNKLKNDPSQFLLDSLWEFTSESLQVTFCYQSFSSMTVKMMVESLSYDGYLLFGKGLEQNRFVHLVKKSEELVQLYGYPEEWEIRAPVRLDRLAPFCSRPIWLISVQNWIPKFFEAVESPPRKRHCKRLSRSS